MKIIQNSIRIIFLLLFIFLTLNGNPMIWFIFFAISLIVAIFFGRIYCGYICPMNTCMVFVNGSMKNHRNDKRQVPYWLLKKQAPYIFLLLTIISVLVLKQIFHVNLPIMLIWIFISIFSVTIFKPYVFHNHICPFGVLQKLFSKSPIFSKAIDTQKCINCLKCQKVCNSNAINFNNSKLEINSSLCHQCQDCTLTCPLDAINYRKKSRANK